MERQLELANLVSWMPGVNSNAETSVNGSIGRGEESMIDGATMVSPEVGGVCSSSRLMASASPNAHVGLHR